MTAQSKTKATYTPDSRDEMILTALRLRAQRDALLEALRAITAITPPTPPNYASHGASSFAPWVADLIDAQNAARAAIRLAEGGDE